MSSLASYGSGHPGKAPIQGEVLKKQEQIYRDLGVEPLLAAPEMK